MPETCQSSSHFSMRLPPLKSKHEHTEVPETPQHVTGALVLEQVMTFGISKIFDGGRAHTYMLYHLKRLNS